MFGRAPESLDDKVCVRVVILYQEDTHWRSGCCSHLDTYKELALRTLCPGSIAC
jgi:hypothetical protein